MRGPGGAWVLVLWVLAFGCTARFAAAAAGFQSSEVYRTAFALLETGKAEEAYILLRGFEVSYGGDPQFDYLYGVAALDSGHIGEASFSLERVAASAPHLVGARLDLARAQYGAGDLKASRRTLEQLRRLDPPPEAAAAVDHYLELLDRRELAKGRRWGLGFELEGGYDSNANSGTQVDSFGPVVLDALSRETYSAYSGFGGILAYDHPLAARLHAQTGLRLGHREYPDADFVSASGGAASAGLIWFVGDNFALEPGVFAAAQYLDGEYSQRVLGVTLGGRRAMGEAQQFAAQLRAGEVRYEFLNGLDVKQLIGTLTWRWRAPSAPQLQLEAGPIAGQETGPSGSAYSRRLAGAQLSAAHPWRGWVWRAAAGYLRSSYDELPLLGEREDRQLTLRVAADSPPLFGSWRLTPHLAHVANPSNVSLYDYRRVEAGLSARWSGP